MMHLVKFCEYRYQELSLKSQTDQEFDAATDAEIKAVHYILNTYRNALKWSLVPKALVDYALVALGKKDEPRAALKERLAELKAKDSLERSGAKEEMV